MTARVVACFAIDRHRILREHSGGAKKRAVMLAAVEAVTKADPVWPSRRHNPDIAAQATAHESVHAASPLRSSGEVSRFGEVDLVEMKDRARSGARGDR